MITTKLPNPIRKTRVLKLVFITIPCLKFWAQSPKLKTGYRYENQFWNPGLTDGRLGSYMDIHIFVMKYYFILFLHTLHFFKSLKSKPTQTLRPQKGNSGVSFNDTLLNFGLIISFWHLLLNNCKCVQFSSSWLYSALYKILYSMDVTCLGARIHPAVVWFK